MFSILACVVSIQALGNVDQSLASFRAANTVAVGVDRADGQVLLFVIESTSSLVHVALMMDASFP